ncbi:pilin [Candidatus Saccharibacteria bacterium]|nr:pilin [Candidatus Saccharibacteria bacterium]
MKVLGLLAAIDVNVPKVSGDRLMTNILNLAYFILGMVAVIFIIMAGYRYLTANGDPAKAQKAMQTILYAVIGLVVVVAAFAITNFVFGRV